MEWVIAVVIVFVTLVFLANLLSPDKKLSYTKRKTLLSPAERSFYGVLKKSIPSEIEITCKVRVADVITPIKGMSRSNWQTAFNKISAKHFDYVLCSAKTMEVLAVVELDDKSHNKPSRIKRDEFLVKACEDTQLPLIRFPAKASYTIEEVRTTIIQALESAAEPEK
jgi:Protein of unknown function (DUF2726)